MPIKKKTEQVSLKRVRLLLYPVTTAGAILSNVAYNLKQRDDLPADVRQLLEECQAEWDEAIRQLPNKWRKRALKRKI